MKQSGKPPDDDGWRSQELPKGLAESFNVFQATVALLAIFIGFVFTALMQILVTPGAIPVNLRIPVYLLTTAILFLTIALFANHLVAHRVLHVRGIFFPKTLARSVMGLSLPCGVLLMFFTLAHLLADKGFCLLAWLLLGGSILTIVYVGVSIYSLKKTGCYKTKL